MKRFRLNGNDYDYDPAALFDLTFGEARGLKAGTGLTIADWHQGLTSIHRADPDVLAGIVWVVLRRAGGPVDWADVDAISTVDLLGSVTDVEDPPETIEEPVVDEPEPVTKPVAKRNGKASTKQAAVTA